MEFSISNTVNQPVDTVWNIVRNFGGIHQYVAAIAQSSAESNEVGTLRTCVLQDGAELQEKLLELNDSSRTLVYTVIDPSPLPMRDYVSTMQLKDNGDGTSELTWSGTYEPNGAPVEAIEGLLGQVYSSAAPGLEASLA